MARFDFCAYITTSVFIIYSWNILNFTDTDVEKKKKVEIVKNIVFDFYDLFSIVQNSSLCQRNIMTFLKFCKILA